MPWLALSDQAPARLMHRAFRQHLLLAISPYAMPGILLQALCSTSQQRSI